MSGYYVEEGVDRGLKQERRLCSQSEGYQAMVMTTMAGWWRLGHGQDSLANAKLRRRWAVQVSMAAASG